MDEDYDEYPVSFEGPCTCLISCPSYDNPEKHGWGGCSEEDCKCDAGWTE